MKRILFLLVGLVFVCGVYALDKDFVIVIDPGHGGKDPGAIRGDLKEKTINLAVANELGRLIEKNMPEVEVVYTRKTDVFVPLEKRSEIANQNKANLFISIHTNSTAAKTTSVSGADTYILGLARSAENLAVAKRENSVIKYEDDYTTKYEGFDPDSPESYIIFEFMTNQYMQQSLDVASFIQSDFKNKAKRVDRGVRQAGFLVLRESGMPSILVELGYINNSVEGKYLNSPTGQRTMASAIYSGFKKYKEDFDKKRGVTPASNNVEEQTPISASPKATAQVSPTPQPKAPAQTQTAKSVQPKADTNRTTALTPKSSSTTPSGVTEYRIQFLYEQVKLPENSPRFKGLQNVSYYEDNGYKYTVGSTTDFNDIRKLHNEVKKKFSDSFIIQMKDGKRVK